MLTLEKSVGWCATVILWWRHFNHGGPVRADSLSTPPPPTAGVGAQKRKAEDALQADTERRSRRKARQTNVHTGTHPCGTVPACGDGPEVQHCWDYHCSDNDGPEVWHCSDGAGSDGPGGGGGEDPMSTTKSQVLEG